MSLIAVVNFAGFMRLHGDGPSASTDKTLPVTSEQLKWSAAPVVGLTPIFPVTAEVGTSVIPVSDRMTNSPAVPRTTFMVRGGGGGVIKAMPLPSAAWAIAVPRRRAGNVGKRFRSFVPRPSLIFVLIGKSLRKGTARILQSRRSPLPPAGYKTSISSS